MKTSLLKKIKKLLEKAESAKKIGSLAEAETFAQKAQSLLSKHNLELSEIEGDDEKEVIHEYMKAWHSSIGGSDKQKIMFPIAKFNFCHVYLIGKQSNNKMMIVGSPENVEICKYIFSIVYNVFLKLSKENYKEYKNEKTYILNGRTSPVGYDTYARSFMAGCANGLYEKLKAEQDRFKAKNEKADALITTNGIVIKNYVTDLYGGWTKGRKTRTKNQGGAYTNGLKAGRSVNINKGVNGSKPIERKQLN